jgi:hypothetical protein
MATTRIEAIERRTVTDIELSCLKAQEAIAVAGLTSDAAKAFIEGLPSIESLMPKLSYEEIAGPAAPPRSAPTRSDNGVTASVTVTPSRRYVTLPRATKMITSNNRAGRTPATARRTEQRTWANVPTSRVTRTTSTRRRAGRCCRSFRICACIACGHSRSHAAVTGRWWNISNPSNSAVSCERPRCARPGELRRGGCDCHESAPHAPCHACADRPLSAHCADMAIDRFGLGRDQTGDPPHRLLQRYCPHRSAVSVSRDEDCWQGEFRVVSI